MSCLPYIVALCPTWRRPACLRNIMALWERQTYPATRRYLVMLDDDGTWPHQIGPNWALYSTAHRYPSLPAKYNALANFAPLAAEAFVIWEDDDVYLPGYIAAHAAAFCRGYNVTHPQRVLSDYIGQVAGEGATGRFMSAMGVVRHTLERGGGWPLTRRADFDQQFIAAMFKAAGRDRVGDPWPGVEDAKIPYCYGWRTGHAHGQGTMRGPDDETWYERAPGNFAPVPMQGKLTPVMDPRTRKIFEVLNYDPA